LGALRARSSAFTGLAIANELGIEHRDIQRMFLLQWKLHE
jgi:hypothetical protein